MTGFCVRTNNKPQSVWPAYSRRPLDHPMHAMTGQAQRWKVMACTDTPCPGHPTGQGTNLTTVQASAIQGFPHDHPWAGTMTAAFAQVGNAIPPLLACAVLGAVA